MRNDLTIYDAVARKWWSDDIRWVRTLKNLVPGRLAWFDRHIDWNGRDVLDLGCAGGFMAEAMAQRGANVTGIDPAAEAIDAARAHARTGGLRIGYDVGVGEALPYDAASFDAVVCVDVLEHVADLAKVLSEVARTLRPGGDSSSTRSTVTPLRGWPPSPSPKTCCASCRAARMIQRCSSNRASCVPHCRARVLCRVRPPALAPAA